MSVPENTTKTETIFKKVDFDYKFKAEVNCDAGEYKEFLKYEVQDDEIVLFGYGDKNDGVDDRGILKVALKEKTTGNVIAGKVRIKSRDKADLIKSTGMAPRTELLDFSRGVRLGREEARVGGTKKRLIVLEVEVDEDKIIDLNASQVEVPVTILKSPNFR